MNEVKFCYTNVPQLHISIVIWNFRQILRIWKLSSFFNITSLKSSVVKIGKSGKNDYERLVLVMTALGVVGIIKYTMNIIERSQLSSSKYKLSEFYFKQ